MRRRLHEAISRGLSLNIRHHHYHHLHQHQSSSTFLMTRRRLLLSSSSIRCFGTSDEKHKDAELLGGSVPPILRGQESPDLNFEYKKHADDDPARLTCEKCGFVAYENPLLVTGSVATIDDPKTSEPMILLCRRAIPPRIGYWNLPAGYMERGECMSQAAAREAKEEALADIKCGPIISIYDIPHIGQVHVYYAAKLQSKESIKPGIESLEVKLFHWSEIPWNELAFPTVSWALMHYQQHMKERGGKPSAPFSNPIVKGHEGSTNVWYDPTKGGLFFDKTWISKA